MLTVIVHYKTPLVIDGVNIVNQTFFNIAKITHEDNGNVILWNYFAGEPRVMANVESMTVTLQEWDSE